jgi:pimeloyl-ACP methyl ester carboxylesterase
MPQLAYEMSGDGAPVVLLHGLTFDRTSWRPIVERLRGRVSSVAFDLPAHGESGGAPLPLDRVAALVHSDLDELGIEQPLVVGHSMSGGLATMYAAAYPVRGAVFVDATPYLHPFVELVHRLEPALRGDAFAETFARVYQPSMGLHLVAPEVMPAQRVRQDVVVGYWEELLSSDPDVFQARVDRLLDAIRVPVLGVFGHELASPERVRLARVGAELEEWAGRGHFVHLAEPDRFAERLLAFTARCETDALADQLAR